MTLMAIGMDSFVKLKTHVQVTYAGRDAQVSVALFFHLLGLVSMTTPEGTAPDSVCKQLLAKCQGLVDVPFKGRGGGGEEDRGALVSGDKKLRNRRTGSDSKATVDGQAVDPRKHKRKPLGVGYSASEPSVSEAAPVQQHCGICAPQNLCAAESVRRGICAPRNLCAAESVRRGICAPRNLCAAESVRRGICAPRNLCAAESVRRGICAPRNLCAAESVHRGICAPWNLCAVESVRRGICALWNLCAAECPLKRPCYVTCFTLCFRKSPLYDNCFLHAPDGQPLCTCDKKKAKWYLDKGIGELLSEDPFIVKLKFEPSGRPESQQDYYLTAKENICVVCGRTESYIRKNIVPHEYRRHFPIQMKDHNSHDVLLLCTSCHAASNYHDNLLKQQLSEEHSAPLGCEEGVRPLEDSDRRQVRSGARALLKADSLPESRREELLGTLRTFYSLDEVTPALLQEAAGLETRIFNESYIPHGLKVVQAYAKGGLRSLMELEKRWRQHFLTSMQPRHIPPLWSVEHNHSKLLRKYGEDLEIQLT
ncbi:UNVERIFIED_CONTAM: hypothetical protein FKN15_050520 [Acipenser sinensis]